jgi:hypothetical protein
MTFLSKKHARRFQMRQKKGLPADHVKEGGENEIYSLKDMGKTSEIKNSFADRVTGINAEKEMTSKGSILQLSNFLTKRGRKKIVIFA